MITKDMCRDCFITHIDPCATKSLLLLGEIEHKCEGCGKVTNTVCAYFKYGEHYVTEDGMHIADTNHVKKSMRPEFDINASYFKQPKEEVRDDGT